MDRRLERIAMGADLLGLDVEMNSSHVRVESVYFSVVGDKVLAEDPEPHRFDSLMEVGEELASLAGDEATRRALEDNGATMVEGGDNPVYRWYSPADVEHGHTKDAVFFVLMSI